MAVFFFENQLDLRNWLIQNHTSETELVVGFYKVGSKKSSITWSQSVDEALCFGWIDGVRKSIDENSYQIRFTQRKPASIWSAINIKKVETLIKKGLMQPAGIAAFEKRTEVNSRIYAHESNEMAFTKDYEQKFKANKIAWVYFQSLAPSYKKISIHWVMTAKQRNTQLKRLNELIEDSERGINKWKENKYNTKNRH